MCHNLLFMLNFISYSTFHYWLYSINPAALHFVYFLLRTTTPWKVALAYYEFLPHSSWTLSLSLGSIKSQKIPVLCKSSIQLIFGLFQAVHSFFDNIHTKKCADISIVILLFFYGPVTQWLCYKSYPNNIDEIRCIIIEL